MAGTQIVNVSNNAWNSTNSSNSLIYLLPSGRRVCRVVAPRPLIPEPPKTKRGKRNHNRDKDTQTKDKFAGPLAQGVLDLVCVFLGRYRILPRAKRGAALGGSGGETCASTSRWSPLAVHSRSPGCGGKPKKRIPKSLSNFEWPLDPKMVPKSFQNGFPNH